MTKFELLKAMESAPMESDITLVDEHGSIFVVQDVDVHELTLAGVKSPMVALKIHKCITGKK